MDDTMGPIHPALKLVDRLECSHPVGAVLRERALQFCNDGQLAGASQFCELLYQLGMDESNAYIQGVARHLLGSIYLVLGNRTTDLDRAAEYFKRSVQLFSTFSGRHRQHNEGVVWLSMGLVYEEQCRRNRERHAAAIQAYKTAHNLLREILDPLERKAEEALHRAMLSMTDRLLNKNRVDASASAPPRPRSGGEPEHAGNTGTSLGMLKTRFSRAGSPTPKAIANVWTSVFGFLELGLILLLLLPIPLLFITHNLMVTLDEYAFLFLVGYYLMAIGVLVNSYVAMFSYKLSPDQAAVVDYRGRIWEEKGSGRHFLVPLFETIRAFIPLQRCNAKVFIREFPPSQGFTLALRVHLGYVVRDASMVWGCIESSVTPRRVLGFFRPPGVEQTSKQIQECVCELARNNLIQLANDPSQQALFQDKAKIEALVLDRLKQESSGSGIEINEIRIEAHIRNG